VTDDVIDPLVKYKVVVDVIIKQDGNYSYRDIQLEVLYKTLSNVFLLLNGTYIPPKTGHK
jgi:hypothetical protein